MKEITSELTEELTARLRESNPLIQIVQGPRQVGKTTALQQFCDKFDNKKPPHFVSADAVVSPIWIQEQWQRARENQRTLIIDEIQKVPDWSETVKKLWDEDKRKKNSIKCILTGSSSLSLQRGLSESLAGRFEVIPAFHWDLIKSQRLYKMSLENYLIYGGYPGSYSFIKKPSRWADYLTHSIVEAVISKDILFQSQVKSPALFRHAFYVLTSFPSQVVSLNKLLGQLQDKGNIDLVKYYLQLYEGAYLMKSIYKYSQNEIRKKNSSPKIVVMAPALSTFHRLDALSAEDHGRIFESAVGSELIKRNLNPYYWADGDHEVDFVLELKKQIIAIEVKSGRSKKSKSLEVFLKKYPEAKKIFINKDNFSQFTEDPQLFMETHSS